MDLVVEKVLGGVMWGFSGWLGGCYRIVEVRIVEVF